jgi:hypothetical protein
MGGNKYSSVGGHGGRSGGVTQGCSPRYKLCNWGRICNGRVRTRNCSKGWVRPRGQPAAAGACRSRCRRKPRRAIARSSRPGCLTRWRWNRRRHDNPRRGARRSRAAGCRWQSSRDATTGIAPSNPRHGTRRRRATRRLRTRICESRAIHTACAPGRCGFPRSTAPAANRRRAPHASTAR